jgi:hypothetical protein
MAVLDPSIVPGSPLSASFDKRNRLHTALSRRLAQAFQPTGIPHREQHRLNGQGLRRELPHQRDQLL